MIVMQRHENVTEDGRVTGRYAQGMRFKGIHPPMTPAERQAKCRAIKRGTWKTYPAVPLPPHEELASSNRSRQFGPPTRKEMPALPAPAAPANPPGAQPALPSPPSTAIQKSASSGSSTSLTLYEGEEPGDALRGCHPPAVAARLRSLLDRHKAGKHLTAAQRAEAEGLLDIAEYFIVQRMRRELAA
jgi:hypothetical protein